MICDLITNPMWVVRVRYQAEFIISGNNKIDSFNVFKSISKLYKKVSFDKKFKFNNRRDFSLCIADW